MAAGKIPFIGFQSLPIGRTRSYRVQNAAILLKEPVVARMRYPKDTVLLILALLTLRRSLKLFRAAAETRHRKGGSLLMQAIIFVGKERRCTPKKLKWVHLKKHERLTLLAPLCNFPFPSLTRNYIQQST